LLWSKQERLAADREDGNARAQRSVVGIRHTERTGQPEPARDKGKPPSSEEPQLGLALP